MAGDKDKDPIIRRRGKKNTDTGRYAGESLVKIDPNAHNASMDDVPPPGVDPGVILTKKPPHTHAGVTVRKLEESKKTSKIISHAEQSLPIGDRD